jgi:hypothetical protein
VCTHIYIYIYTHTHTHIYTYIHSRIREDPVTKTLYVKYHSVFNKVTKEARKQHCSRLIAKSDNEIRTTWNIKKCLGKIGLTEEMPTILAYNDKVKDPEKNC